MSKKYADLEEKFRWDIRGEYTILEYKASITYGMVCRIPSAEQVDYLKNREIKQQVHEDTRRLLDAIMEQLFDSMMADIKIDSIFFKDFDDEELPQT